MNFGESQFFCAPAPVSCADALPLRIVNAKTAADDSAKSAPKDRQRINPLIR
jgi:hypothetical protein